MIYDSNRQTVNGEITAAARKPLEDSCDEQLDQRDSCPEIHALRVSPRGVSAMRLRAALDQGGRLGAKALAVSGLRLAALCATSDSAPRPWQNQNARRMHWPRVTPPSLCRARSRRLALCSRSCRRRRWDRGPMPAARVFSVLVCVCSRARVSTVLGSALRHAHGARARTARSRPVPCRLSPTCFSGPVGPFAALWTLRRGCSAAPAVRCTRGPRRRAEGPASRVIGPGPGLGRAAPAVPHTETGGRQGAHRWRSRGGVVVYWAGEGRLGVFCSAATAALANQAQGDLPAARTQTLSTAEKVGPMRGATALEKPRAAQRRELLLLVDI